MTDLQENSEYEINDNITNVFPFDPGGDSRLNPFEERGIDGNQGGDSRSNPFEERGNDENHDGPSLKDHGDNARIEAIHLGRV